MTTPNDAAIEAAVNAYYDTIKERHDAGAGMVLSSDRKAAIAAAVTAALPHLSAPAAGLSKGDQVFVRYLRNNPKSVVARDVTALLAIIDRLASPAGSGKVPEALKCAIGHIEHMAAWIGQHQHGYSFESLGEDMPGMKAALASAPPTSRRGETAAERPAVYVTQLEKQLGDKLAVAVEALESVQVVQIEDDNNLYVTLHTPKGFVSATVKPDFQSMALSWEQNRRTALSRCKDETAVEGERE